MKMIERVERKTVRQILDTLPNMPQECRLCHKQPPFFLVEANPELLSPKAAIEKLGMYVQGFVALNHVGFRQDLGIYHETTGELIIKLRKTPVKWCQRAMQQDRSS